MSHIKRKSEILLLRPRQSAEIVKLMEEFRGLFKTIAFLTFSGVLEVIKVQEIFLNRNIFVNILNTWVSCFALETIIRTLKLL